MLKVAIISPCMGRYGGLEGFVLTMGRGLMGLEGAEMALILKKTAGFVPAHDLEDRIAESGVRARFCDKASPDLWKAIRGADVIHVQNPCPDVVLMARAMRKPVLINVINHRQEGRSMHQRLWQWCLGLGQRRFYISEFVRRTWEDTERPWQNSQVVFPICELSSLLPASFQERRGFIFISRWIENKGLDTLVEAYSRAKLDPKAWPLQLLGDGPLRSKIKSRVRELGLQGVEMPGFTSEDEKSQRIRRSRFAVIPPNTNEDFGLVAIEARHLGVPCLITRDGGLPEAAGMHSLSCAPGDTEGLACLLRQAAEMSELDYDKLATATRETLRTEMVGNHAGFYLETYQSMLRSRTAAA